MASRSEKIVKNLLSSAGIKFKGKNPEIIIHNNKFYSRILGGGSLALGESYMDGWWDSDSLDVFFYKILRKGLQGAGKKSPRNIALFLLSGIMNFQTISRSRKVGKQHYDKGNDLYSAMLDSEMNYSCGYWKNAKNLDQAQKNKLDLICRKIGLKKGDRVLDIGCGWGSFARHAAKKYGVEVVGITISREQVKLARKLSKNLPIKIRLQDYRDVNEKFDHIISIGMFEHVGYKNYRRFMKRVKNNLKDNGLFLLHTIASNRSVTSTEPWINKYIFPNSMLPSAKQITRAAENIFVLEDWHNFGPYYDPTLIAWNKNFRENWKKIKKNYDERFYRMWNYYLLSCAGAFRARYINLWQIVFSKKGIKGGYKSIR